MRLILYRYLKTAPHRKKNSDQRSVHTSRYTPKLGRSTRLRNLLLYCSYKTGEWSTYLLSRAITPVGTMVSLYLGYKFCQILEPVTPEVEPAPNESETVSYYNYLTVSFCAAIAGNYLSCKLSGVLQDFSESCDSHALCYTANLKLGNQIDNYHDCICAFIRGVLPELMSAQVYSELVKIYETVTNPLGNNDAEANYTKLLNEAKAESELLINEKLNQEKMSGLVVLAKRLLKAHCSPVNERGLNLFIERTSKKNKTLYEGFSQYIESKGPEVKMHFYGAVVWHLDRTKNIMSDRCSSISKSNLLAIHRKLYDEVEEETITFKQKQESKSTQIPALLYKIIPSSISVDEKKDLVREQRALLDDVYQNVHTLRQRNACLSREEFDLFKIKLSKILEDTNLTQKFNSEYGNSMLEAGIRFSES